VLKAGGGTHVDFFLTTQKLLAQIRLYFVLDEGYARRVTREHASTGLSEADIDTIIRAAKAK
jgi:hypothetical protein